MAMAMPEPRSWWVATVASRWWEVSVMDRSGG